MEAGMDPKRYVVSRESPDRWMIGFDIVSIGAYCNEGDAIKTAIPAAFKEGRHNPAGSQVLVERPDGTLRIGWTFGKDAPP
jgi:hypothetical protein